MSVLKQFKFDNVSIPIAKTQIAINNDSNTILSAVPTNIGIDDESDPTYTLALAVDGKTISKTGNDGLQTILKLAYHAAVTTTGNEKGAYIALEDIEGKSIANSEVMVADIIGNGVLRDASYVETTGILTLIFATASGHDTTINIDLGKLLDIDDIIIANNSVDYLTFNIVSPSTETGQATLGVKLANVAFTPSEASVAGNLTVDTTNGKMLDASNAIPSIKSYVLDVLANASTNIEVTAEGDDYVDARVNAEVDNKHVIVDTNVSQLNATAGTAGIYSAEGTEITAPTHGTLSGTANALADASDIATKVKAYVDGELAIESARSDAKNKADIAALDVSDSAVSGEYVSQVAETDGKISVTRATIGGAVIKGFVTDASTSGAIAASDTVSAALNKVQNKVNSIQYRITNTTIEFFGLTVKPVDPPTQQ